MDERITGKHLIAWGFRHGPWFVEALEKAEAARRGGALEGEIIALVRQLEPKPIPMRGEALPYSVNIHADTEDDNQNILDVHAHMTELMRVPTIVGGAVMPDACPSDKRPGTIPVGGVVVTENAIHPGFHSADICCSMAISIFPDNFDPVTLLDAGMKLSHFGGGGRDRGVQHYPDAQLMGLFANNSLLAPYVSMAIEHFATQGDGNHFFYVGRLASSGEICLVTHHGSRGPGAKLYKAGMALAEATRFKLAPEVPKHNAWIVADTAVGAMYWGALQIIRSWTKMNHYAIHDMVGHAVGVQPRDRFWNEHNFVFQKTDGLFYHAKGATPAFPGWAIDAQAHTLIPLNMAEPILIAKGLDAPHALGFAPHGAGRNFSRTHYLSKLGDRPAAEIIAEQAPGIDVRYFSGAPDLSELPGAYKGAAQVRAQIEHYGLAEIVDTVEPVGSIMAGDWQAGAPWRQKKAKRAVAE